MPCAPPRYGGTPLDLAQSGLGLSSHSNHSSRFKHLANWRGPPHRSQNEISPFKKQKEPGATLERTGGDLNSDPTPRAPGISVPIVASIRRLPLLAGAAQKRDSAIPMIARVRN